MKTVFAIATLTIVGLPTGSWAATTNQLNLLRNPSLSAETVAFLHRDDIWGVPRTGGVATRLTSSGKVRGGPLFSPDGRYLAFSAEADGSTDIFVMPSIGGEPRRLTFHPDTETLVGWSPDGRQVVFASSRASSLRNAPQLFSARADGFGTPTLLPLPTAATGSISPDGRRLAYTPFTSRGWKGYRGGRAPYIWIADLETLDVVQVPHTEASDWNPIWFKGKVYFLSDRDGPVGLYSFDSSAGVVKREIARAGEFDFQSAQAGPGGIVIDALGSLLLFEPSTGRSHTISVSLPRARLEPRRVELPGRRATALTLSPDGRTYAVEARGEIFVVPNERNATARNVTESPAVADRAPVWSPDGLSIAYLSDASGEYRLVIRSVERRGKARTFSFGDGRGIFSQMSWSPDGRSFAYADERAVLWTMQIDSGQSTRVAQDPFGVYIEPGSWSSDGRTLAYVTRTSSMLGVIQLYDLQSARSFPLTDGRIDTFSPAFDRRAKKIYFLASADRPMASTQSMASNGVPYSAGLYVADLSDPARPAIQRMSIPAREYRAIEVAEDAIYLLEGSAGKPLTVWRVAADKTQSFLSDVQAFEVTMNGRAAIVRRGAEAEIVTLSGLQSATSQPESRSPVSTALIVPALPLTVDVQAEWQQIYREGWRFQRDLFYADHYNGVDITATEARYKPFVKGLSSRRELTYLMREAFSELRVSHMAVSDPPNDDPGMGQNAVAQATSPRGFLCADYVPANERYQFARIYTGDMWLAGSAGPLGVPGVSVNRGDYLIAVEDKQLQATDNIDRAFEGMVGKPTRVTVASDASGAPARTYTVIPVANEFPCRHATWIADNRRKVDELSGGKLAYVYIINTTEEAYSAFNAQYLAQTDKSGIVLDERNNGGGPVADFVIGRLKRAPLVQVWPPNGEMSQPFPTDLIDGPAAMIVNEVAGSGGDILPYMFRKVNLGPIVGKRTWGGTIGVGLSPLLIDGGAVGVPHYPISDPIGTWGDLEGYGITPDVVVEQDPKAVAAGRDPQLEAAVQVAMKRLEAQPVAPRKPPPSRAATEGGRGN